MSFAVGPTIRRGGLVLVLVSSVEASAMFACGTRVSIGALEDGGDEGGGIGFEPSDTGSLDVEHDAVDEDGGPIYVVNENDD